MASYASTTAPTPHVVSTTQYNVFRFPSPVLRAVLPPHAPIDGRPYYLSGNRVLLLRFRPDHGKPIQMIVELADGSTTTLFLRPSKSAPGQRIALPGKAGNSFSAPGANPNAIYVPVLQSALEGAIPACYHRAATLPGVKLYNRVRLVARASWTSNSARLTAWQVMPRQGLTSTLDPSQFYTPGVKAALLTGSLVDRDHTPTLYLVTQRGGSHD